MGAGNIVIAMLYRRTVENGQDPVTALRNTYGVELDKATLECARGRIRKFMAHFTDADVTGIVEHNFVNSDIFDWDLATWTGRSRKQKSGSPNGVSSRSDEGLSWRCLHPANRKLSWCDSYC